MIDIVAEYSDKWRFELSAKKTEVLVFGQKNKKEEWFMYGQNLNVVTSFKYLGVEFQKTGAWADVCK